MEKATILVVEDNALNMKLVRSLLQLVGHQVLEAEDAEQGIRLASLHRPDLILMDIQLPGMDGLEATRILKRNKELNKIPVVALTSYAMPGDEQKTREASCSGYITKPIDTRRFIQTIQGFLTPSTQPVETGKGVIGRPRILIVDDDPLNIKLMKAELPAEKFETLSAPDGPQAIQIVLNERPDLILLDIMMPEMDGFEVCQRLKSMEESKEIPVIFLSSLTGLEEKVRGFGLGAVDFISKPFQREELQARLRTHLELSQLRTKLEDQVVERTIQLQRLTEELKQSLEKLRKTMVGIIQAMALTVESKDPYTAGHQLRVSHLARSIAQEMGLSQDQIEAVRMSGMVHDLGKISFPAQLLSKPTQLSDLEFGLIKVHPQISFDILKDIDFPWPVAQIVFQHHERINGTGYPLGLFGNEIYLEAKILAVADVVEAIASHRPYRPALGIKKALDEISQNRDILYDPGVVDACLRLFKEKGFQLKQK
jgi:putative two-component system response regulator